MTWLERGLYLAILAVLGLSVAAMKDRNGELSKQLAAEKPAAGAPSSAATETATDGKEAG